ncbi:MAG: hypothetical protein JNK78_06905 [Planctomycetes bacterium]|nr:hypothetical protein [Planctomycetota bacterium]
MEAKSEVNVGKFIGRRISQLRIMTRLMEHELEAAKGAREVSMERQLVESMLDTLEVFVDDCESVAGGRDRSKADAKPVVARLN